MIGKTLGYYRIVEKLGAGGMGVVYRADDSHLGRQVAIKVLPDAFTGDPERLARFEREAKLLASLNHPNIAAIYGLEEADGKRFLVLELVEGETLAEGLSRGPLPIEAALGVCRQIAEGVEAAHEKGIIHRDLKPGNVKITPEGKVKILDFGLAKAYQREGSVPDLSKSPTLTDEMTRPGVILGTVAYMSPEQATGKPVDRRTDVWAFGCVMFECLTGRQAFQGDTVTEILAAILRGEPDWQALPAATSWKVKDLLHRCLRKDPKERLHDIADARIEIGESIGQPLETVTVARRFSVGWLAAGAAMLLLAGVLIEFLVRRATQPAPSFPVVRSVIKLESGHWLDGMRTEWALQRPFRTAVAMSKDGHFIVYSAITENPGPQAKPQLYLRRTDQSEAKPMAGTEGGINPFLSPDDRWVGFWAGGKLMKVSIDGGVAVTLCDVLWPFGTSWGPENSIIFAPGPGSGLFRVSAEGGELESLTTPERTHEEYGHRLPHCLPDGKGVLFTIMREAFDLQPRIALLDLKTRKWRVLMGDAADGRYVPTGHLVFLRQGTLMVVPFDLERHEVTGQPVPAIANVMQALNVSASVYNTAAGQFSISDSGWLVYAEGGILPDRQNSLVWVDHKGGAEPIASFKAPFFAPRLSPDGQRIAYTTLGREQPLWVYDLNRGTASRLTDEGRTSFVTWTPDGKRVVFDWSKTGAPNLYWQPADGSSAMERLMTSDYWQFPGSWSPDGTTLAFVEWPQLNIGDVLLLDLRSRRITPFLNSRADERYPEFSPDGRWMAYASDESGRWEVYVRPFPGPGGKWLISQEGGMAPLWARDGKQLFYKSGPWGHEKVWVVDVRTDGGFSASKPRLLFNAPGLGSGNPIRTWDLSLDGQRFLMVKIEEAKSTPVTEMVLVMNWFEELKRLAPTNR
jgi:Tol biopolymer transport system component